MGGIPGDVPLGVLEGEVPGGHYLLQAANGVPEAGINAGEWVVASQIAPTGPEQLAAYYPFTGGDVLIGVAGQLEHCVVYGTVVAVLRSVDTANGQEG